jgi:predicted AAA+ superfamily ATPase
MIDENILTTKDIRGSYRPRIIDSAIERSLSTFGGVQIVGPKWCGKSWSGIYHSHSSIFLGDEDTKRSALLEPKAILQGEYPILVDEWQEVPKLWDIARLNIDFSAKKGMYIFTGSTTPPKNSTVHSGVGRFIPLNMHTMSLYESGESTGTVSLTEMFKGSSVEPVKSQLDYHKTVKMICRGGWPGAIGIDEDRIMDIPKAYIEKISKNDASKVDGKKKNPDLVKKLIRSLARNTATPASIDVLAKDIVRGGNPPSNNTVITYLEALKGLFMVEEQRGWSPNLRSTVRTQSSPRRHLTDPSLAAAALCGGPGELRQDPKTAGFLFESMCYRDLCVYTSAIGGEVFYYRDSNGLEVDFIIQLDDGRWGAAEAKLGAYEFEKATHNLFRMKEKMVAGGVREPSFMIILNATGGIAVKREDGIIEVPIDCLGP